MELYQQLLVGGAFEHGRPPAGMAELVQRLERSMASQLGEVHRSMLAAVAGGPPPCPEARVRKR